MGICFLHPLTLRNPIPFITLSHVVEGRVQPKPGWQNQTPSPGEGRPWWELESLCADLGVPSNLQPNSALTVKATQKFQLTAGGWIPEVIKEAPVFFQSWMEVGLMCSQIRKSGRDGDEEQGCKAGKGIGTRAEVPLSLCSPSALPDPRHPHSPGAQGLSGGARAKWRSHDSDGKRNVQKRRKHLKREL